METGTQLVYLVASLDEEEQEDYAEHRNTNGTERRRQTLGAV